MPRLHRVLTLSVLVSLLLVACGVPDAPTVSEATPAPGSVTPPLSTDPALAPSTAPLSDTALLTPTLSTAPLSDTALLTPTLNTATVPPSAVSPTPTPTPTSLPPGAPQPLDLGPISAAWADFTLQTSIVLTTTREGLQPLSWSPDGTRLLFKRSHDLWLYTVATNEARRLVQEVRAAIWSPDGQRVAYIPVDIGTPEMYDRRVLVLDLATGQVVELVNLQAHGPIASNLVWTPERGMLLAVGGQILAYPETTKPAPPVTVFTVPPALAAAGGIGISVAPDGRHALVYSGESAQQMVSFVTDGSVTKTIAVFASGSAVWAPDGQRVAFGHDGEFFSIYSAEGELLATSTPDTLKLWLLDWSPDGQYLLYSTNGGGTGPYQVYIVKPGGSGSLALPAPFLSPGSDGMGHALWSPTGQHIAYVIDDRTTVLEPPHANSYLLIATITRP